MQSAQQPPALPSSWHRGPGRGAAAGSVAGNEGEGGRLTSSGGCRGSAASRARDVQAGQRESLLPTPPARGHRARRWHRAATASAAAEASFRTPSPLASAASPPRLGVGRAHRSPLLSCFGSVRSGEGNAEPPAAASCLQFCSSSRLYCNTGSRAAAAAKWGKEKRKVVAAAITVNSAESRTKLLPCPGRLAGKEE